MTVNVKFDDRTWARLAAIADRVGSTVPDLLTDSVQRLIVGTSRFPQQQPTRGAELARTRIEHKRLLTSQIIRLRSRGRTVREIADLVGYSTTYVSKILCDNGHRTHQPHTERTAA